MPDQLTRSEYEKRFPDIQARYLAWCASIKALPTDEGLKNHEYIAWNNRSMRVFRAREALREGQPLSDIQQALYTEFLWERGEEFVE